MQAPRGRTARGSFGICTACGAAGSCRPWLAAGRGDRAPPLGQLKLERLGWVSKFTIDVPTDGKTPVIRKTSTRTETTSFTGRSGPEGRPTRAQNVVETEKEVDFTYPAADDAKPER